MPDDTREAAFSVALEVLAGGLGAEGVILPPEAGLRLVGRLVEQLAAEGLLKEGTGTDDAR